MLKIRRLPVGQLATNCYLIIDGKEAIVVDPGDDADYIQRILSDEEAVPTKIIATHGHYDHVLAITELKLAYKIPFLMHKKDEFLLKKMANSAKYFSGISADPVPKVDLYLTRFNPVKVGKTKLEVIETPGHSPGSVSLYSKEANIIFVGDLVFAGGGVGRTDFSYSKILELNDSIDKIIELPGETTVYPGHGDETRIKDIISFQQ